MAQLGPRRDRRIQIKPAEETEAEMKQKIHETKLKEKHALLEKEFEKAVQQELIEQGAHTAGETQVRTLLF